MKLIYFLEFVCTVFAVVMRFVACRKMGKISMNLRFEYLLVHGAPSFLESIQDRRRLLCTLQAFLGSMILPRYLIHQSVSSHRSAHPKLQVDFQSHLDMLIHWLRNPESWRHTFSLYYFVYYTLSLQLHLQPVIVFHGKNISWGL